MRIGAGNDVGTELADGVDGRFVGCRDPGGVWVLD